MHILAEDANVNDDSIAKIDTPSDGGGVDLSMDKSLIDAVQLLSSSSRAASLIPGNGKRSELKDREYGTGNGKDDELKDREKGEADALVHVKRLE